jgi:hypothetical protein
MRCGSNRSHRSRGGGRLDVDNGCEEMLWMVVSGRIDKRIVVW